MLFVWEAAGKLGVPAGDPDCFEFVKLLSLRWDDNWLKKTKKSTSSYWYKTRLYWSVRSVMQDCTSIALRLLEMSSGNSSEKWDGGYKRLKWGAQITGSSSEFSRGSFASKGASWGGLVNWSWAPSFGCSWERPSSWSLRGNPEHEMRLCSSHLVW